MIILDTDVLSGLMRRAPADRVVQWVGEQPAAGLYTASTTLAEILHGILLQPAGRKRGAFETAAEAMFEQEFAGRILPFESDAAPLYARIAVDRRRAGRPISHFDAQIAAIARLAGATVATRNTSDFQGCGVKVVNPWS